MQVGKSIKRAAACSVVAPVGGYPEDQFSLETVFSSVGGLLLCGLGHIDLPSTPHRFSVFVKPADSRVEEADCGHSRWWE